jgi:hypothetical protein
MLRMELNYGDSEGNLKHRIYGQASKVFLQDPHCDKNVLCFKQLHDTCYIQLPPYAASHPR